MCVCIHRAHADNSTHTHPEPNSCFASNSCTPAPNSASGDFLASVRMHEFLVCEGILWDSE